VSEATGKTSWAILSAVDVGDKIEKKNNLSYLSWAWAWGVLKQHFPYATFTKHTAPNGMPYFMDNQGYAFVRVTVSLNYGATDDITEMLPVLDHRNKPIQGPNAFDVNNALQRCLTKAIAYHGLGHYIYAGEDVPAEAIGSPPEGQVAVPAPTPAKTTTSASAGTSSVSLPMVGIDGSENPVSPSSEIIAKVFTTFIPQCKDEKSLTSFYTSNKLAIAFLKDRDEALHKSVMDAFAARKAAIKSQPKN
jgi:hypothetical protein